MKPVIIIDPIELSKGRKALPNGTRRQYGNKWFVKTDQGWKPDKKQGGTTPEGKEEKTRGNAAQNEAATTVNKVKDLVDKYLNSDGEDINSLAEARRLGKFSASDLEKFVSQRKQFLIKNGTKTPDSAWPKINTVTDTNKISSAKNNSYVSLQSQGYSAKLIKIPSNKIKSVLEIAGHPFVVHREYNAETNKFNGDLVLTSSENGARMFRSEGNKIKVEKAINDAEDFLKNKISTDKLLLAIAITNDNVKNSKKYTYTPEGLKETTKSDTDIDTVVKKPASVSDEDFKNFKSRMTELQDKFNNSSGMVRGDIQTEAKMLADNIKEKYGDKAYNELVMNWKEEQNTPKKEKKEKSKRVSIREGEYRGKKGFTVSDGNSHIFTTNKNDAEKIKDILKDKKVDHNKIDEILRNENKTQGATDAVDTKKTEEGLKGDKVTEDLKNALDDAPGMQKEKGKRGRKALPVGTQREYGGKMFVKTENGWKLVKKEKSEPVKLDTPQGTQKIQDNPNNLSSVISGIAKNTRVKFTMDGVKQPGIFQGVTEVTGELKALIKVKGHDFLIPVSSIQGITFRTPKTPAEETKVMEKATPETRSTIQAEMTGTPIEDHDIPKYDYDPGTYNLKTKTGKDFGKVKDYTKVEPIKIGLISKKDILSKERPSWIPQISDRVFKDGGHRLEFTQIGEDEYLVNAMGAGSSDEYVVMNLATLVATQDYYLKRAKTKHDLDEKERIETSKERFRKRADELESRIKDETNPGTIKHLQGEVDWYREQAEKGKFETKRLSTMGRNNSSYKMMEMHAQFYNGPVKGSRWDIHRDLMEKLYQKELDMEAQRDELLGAYSKGEETSYGDKGTVDNLIKDYGVKVKMQNGSAVKPEDIKNVQAALKDVYSKFGDRSSMARKFGLKISLAGEKMQHARKAIGIYFPTFRAIGVSGTTSNEMGFTLSHEWTHFMDNYLGKESSNWYASDKVGSLEHDIASTFRNNMEKGKSNTGYWYRTCECFARAFEQYFIGEAREEQYYIKDKVKFDTLIKPKIEQFFKERNDLLKSMEVPLVPKMLLKAKALPEGTIRNWNGIDYEKRNGEWAKVHKNEKSKLKETSDNKKSVPAKETIYKDALGNPNYKATISVFGGNGTPGTGYLSLQSASTNVPEKRWDFTSKNVDYIVKEMDKLGWDSKVTEDGYGRPLIHLEHRATKYIVDTEEKLHNKKWEKAKDVYIRFGNIPEGGRSKDWSSGNWEKGVSVFKGKILPSGELLVLPSTNQQLGSLVTMNDRPMFVIKGKEIGTGADGEPVLSQAKAIKPKDAAKQMFTKSKITLLYVLSKAETFSGHPLQGREKIHGMDISIENKKGSYREGKDKDGHKWKVKMHHSYGYIRGMIGKDKEHVDCYLGPNKESEKVFIIHQNDPTTGKYDEDKVMLAFDSAEQAKAAYLKQYDRSGFFGSMDETTVDKFKKAGYDKDNHGKKLVIKSTASKLLLRVKR